MRKMIFVSSLAVALVGSQVAASAQSANGFGRVGDRVGARAGASQGLSEAVTLPTVLAGLAGAVAVLGYMSAKSDVDDLRDDNRQLAALVGQLTASQTADRATISGLLSQIQTLLAGQQTLLAQQAAANVRIDALLAQQAAANARIDALLAQIEELRRRLDAAASA